MAPDCRPPRRSAADGRHRRTPTTPWSRARRSTVSDPAKGVIANDINVYGVTASWRQLPAGTDAQRGRHVHLHTAGTAPSDSSPTAATARRRERRAPPVTLGAVGNACGGGAIDGGRRHHLTPADVATVTGRDHSRRASCRTDTDAAGYPLTVDRDDLQRRDGLELLSMDPNGGFTAIRRRARRGCATPSPSRRKNSQGTVSASPATVTVTFPAASGLAVTVLDGSGQDRPGDHRLSLDHRGRPHLLRRSQLHHEHLHRQAARRRRRIVPTFGTNFHTSYMPVVAHGLHRARCPAKSGQTHRLGAACGVRRRQRRLPDRRRAARRRSIPARSIWTRPSATTSRFCRAMRPTRSNAGNAGAHGLLDPAVSGHLRPRHGWRSDPAPAAPRNHDCMPFTSVTVTQTHALPAGEALGVRVRGRLPAERRAGCRRRQSTCCRPTSPAWAASTSPSSTMPAAPAMRPAR